MMSSHSIKIGTLPDQNCLKLKLIQPNTEDTTNTKKDTRWMYTDIKHMLILQLNWPTKCYRILSKNLGLLAKCCHFYFKSNSLINTDQLISYLIQLKFYH